MNLFLIFVGITTIATFIASRPFVYGEKLSRGMLDGLNLHPIANGFDDHNFNGHDYYNPNSYLMECKE